jgi:hypothetical protein
MVQLVFFLLKVSVAAMKMETSCLWLLDGCVVLEFSEGEGGGVG